MTSQYKWQQTSCWDCCAVYPMLMPKCPQCGAHNANVDHKAALTQMNQRRQDAERAEWERKP